MVGLPERDLEGFGIAAVNRLLTLDDLRSTWALMSLSRGATADDLKKAQRAARPLRSVAFRLWALYRDVSSFMPAVRSLEATARAALPDYKQAIALYVGDQSASRAADVWTTQRPIDAYVAALKGMHFHIRALQDAMYAVLCELTPGCTSGRAASMAKALNEGNPLHRPIEASAPGYCQWFARHRDLRNTIKLGLLHGWGVAASAHDAGTPVLTMTPGDVDLQTIADGIAMSPGVLKLIATLAEQMIAAGAPACTPPAAPPTLA